MDLSKLSDAELEAIANGDHDAFLRATAARQGVRPELAAAVRHQESGGNGRAVSPKGARGQMQLMPGTAADMGVNPADDFQNIAGGVGYLKQQLDSFGGDEAKALAAYNAGPKAVRDHGGIPPYPETQAYVRAVQARAPDIRQASDAELEAIAGGAATSEPQHIDGTARVVRDEPVKIPAKRAVGKDIGIGLTRGAMRGGAGVADSVLQAGPIGMVSSGLAAAADMASLISGGRGLPRLRAPASPMSDLVVRTVPTAETGLGHFSEKLGANAVNAFLPGSWGQRIANVVLPSLGQEGGERAVKAMGGDENAAAIGGVVGAGVGGLATGLRLSAFPKADIESLRQAVKDAYAKVDASGFVFPKARIAGLVDDLTATMKGRALSKEAADSARNIIKYARGLADADLPLSQLEKLRGDIYPAMVSKGSDIGALGRDFRAKIDAVIDAVPNGDVRNARALKTQLAKAETVSRKLDSAELRSSGADAAIRSKMRPLMDPDSPQRLPNLSPAEAAALAKTVKGTAGRNIAAFVAGVTDPRRLGGKILAPMLGTGSVMTAIPTGGASLLAPAAQLGVGLTATRAANQGARKSVDDLLRLIVESGVPTPPGVSYAGLAGITAPLLAIPATASARPARK